MSVLSSLGINIDRFRGPTVEMSLKDLFSNYSELLRVGEALVSLTSRPKVNVLMAVFFFQKLLFRENSTIRNSIWQKEFC